VREGRGQREVIILRHLASSVTSHEQSCHMSTFQRPGTYLSIISDAFLRGWADLTCHIVGSTSETEVGVLPPQSHDMGT
jgi:hypothetical protein